VKGWHAVLFAAVAAVAVLVVVGVVVISHVMADVLSRQSTETFSD
jgi:uncharacterized membrane protein (DUF485 family)